MYAYSEPYSHFGMPSGVKRQAGLLDARGADEDDDGRGWSIMGTAAKKRKMNLAPPGILSTPSFGCVQQVQAFQVVVHTGPIEDAVMAHADSEPPQRRNQLEILRNERPESMQQQQHQQQHQQQLAYPYCLYASA
ncbi:hypothetical protein DIPPA_18129 [Diplonema papillatum]|nr:hypothetical protein DIPPA_18129 [Diplonema papillatum]